MTSFEFKDKSFEIIETLSEFINRLNKSNSLLSRIYSYALNKHLHKLKNLILAAVSQMYLLEQKDDNNK